MLIVGLLDNFYFRITHVSLVPINIVKIELILRNTTCKLVRFIKGCITTRCKHDETWNHLRQYRMEAFSVNIEVQTKIIHLCFSIKSISLTSFILESLFLWKSVDLHHLPLFLSLRRVTTFRNLFPSLSYGLLIVLSTSELLQTLNTQIKYW